jgi:hypothetical protein
VGAADFTGLEDDERSDTEDWSRYGMDLDVRAVVGLGASRGVGGEGGAWFPPTLDRWSDSRLTLGRLSE